MKSTNAKPRTFVQIVANATLSVAFSAFVMLASVSNDANAHPLGTEVSANEANRLVYRWLAKQGYSRRRVGPGSARVRDITRADDTWVVQVSFSNGTAVQSGRTTLYVDAKTALVSDTPPDRRPRSVVAR